MVLKYSENTQKNNKHILERLVKFYPDKSLLKMSEQDILQFREHLQLTPKQNGSLRSNNSINIMMQRLSGFFTWLVSIKLIQKHKHPIAKKQRVVDGYIVDEGIEALPKEDIVKNDKFIVIDSLPNNELLMDLVMIPTRILQNNKQPHKYEGYEKRAFRNHLYMLLLARYGMRIEEPSDLQWSNINFDKQIFLIEHRKNDESTLFPLLKDVEDAILFYYKILRRKRVKHENIPNYVFAVGSKSISSDAIRNAVYEYQKSWNVLFEYNQKRIDDNKLPVSIYEVHRVFRATWWTLFGMQLPYLLGKYLFGQRPPKSEQLSSTKMQNLILDSQGLDKTAEIYTNPAHIVSGWGGDLFREIMPEPNNEQFYIDFDYKE